MPPYKAPGVYVEELAKIPPSVAEVSTAIPAFIGLTEKAKDRKGGDLPVNTPVRITSLLEFEKYFGFADPQQINVNIEQKRAQPSNQIFETLVNFSGAEPKVPTNFLYYSMQMYFANDGGPCYVVSIGGFAEDLTLTARMFTDAIDKLQEEDEPTLLVFPDACQEAPDGLSGLVISHALASCAKMQDRFTIADVYNAVPEEGEEEGEEGEEEGEEGEEEGEEGEEGEEEGEGEEEADDDITAVFRSSLPSEIEMTKYGAAYFPYLETSLNFITIEDEIKIQSHTITDVPVDPDAGQDTEDPAVLDTGEDGIPISDDSVKVNNTLIYNSIKSFIQNNAKVTLPPSGAIAGIYARVDRSRGVWKAPANVGIKFVEKPALKITNDLNERLNVTSSGKSVNAIRTFAGKGTLVWGARTLAGNDNEWRYVPVRRFFIFVEESIKNSITPFVFEPNTANTWVKVKGMIENFLNLQWQAGALAGAKPHHAFYVKVGINETMSAQDILEGRMIVEVGLAVARPAEFIVIEFSHMMQRS